jgi:hypothetical protein
VLRWHARREPVTALRKGVATRVLRCTTRFRDGSRAVAATTLASRPVYLRQHGIDAGPEQTSALVITGWPGRMACNRSLISLPTQAAGIVSRV